MTGAAFFFAFLQFYPFFPVDTGLFVDHIRLINKGDRQMKTTARFDHAKHAIAVSYQRRLIDIRYLPYCEHVKCFYRSKWHEFSQMKYVKRFD